jgi:serine/threonine-protein kinase
LLLSGHHPAGEARTSPARLLKAIVETEPGRASEAANASDAETRSTTGDALRRQLRGDLDTIVAKARKKDPADRYASVGAFAEDIRRYLGHEPIAARRTRYHRVFVRARGGAGGPGGLVAAVAGRHLAGPRGAATRRCEARSPVRTAATSSSPLLSVAPAAGVRRQLWNRA